jgi:acetyltransferase-like isoleucine patch superfamily enzyme
MRFFELCRQELDFWRKKRLLTGKFPDVSFGKNFQVIGLNSVSIGRGSCIGDSVWINDCRIDGKKRIRIGSTVLIGRGSVISTAGSLEIGDFCILAPSVIVADADHIYNDPLKPYLQQGATTDRSIVIEENCWLGMHAKILGNSIVGRGSIVGAGSLVNGVIPPFSVVVGVPARIVKLYDFSKNEWLKVNSDTEVKNILANREKNDILPDREAYKKNLLATASFTRLDPLLAGNGICV